MSYVVLQVGQCGNQLGSEFFNTIAETVNQKRPQPSRTFSDEVKLRFFSESKTDSRLLARAVLVDTEPKVIRETLASAKQQPFWHYQDDTNCNKKEGSANNWAMGYFYHGTSIRDSVLELVHKEAERCDYLHGFLSFMSVAGGTGSGLGTFLTEALKDEFPSVPIMNQVVWPFMKGEVTVQSYNAILTLSHLQSISDAVCIFENDQLFKLCMQRMGLRDVSLSHLNSIASHQLACLLLPSTVSGVTPIFGDILAHLVPHPQFKLLSLRSVPQESPAAHPFSFYTWQALLRTLRRMLLYSSIVDEVTPGSSDPTKVLKEQPLSLANLLLLRGPDSDTADSELLHKPTLPYASWVPPSARLKTWTHPLPILGQDRTATLANNGQFLIPCIDSAVSKGWKMFNYKAYLHHYWQRGLTEDEFIECFTQIEQIIANYKTLTSV